MQKNSLVNKKILALIVFVSLVFSVFFVTEVWSGQEPFDRWLDEFRAEALQAGISEMTLGSALVNVQPQQRILESDRNQPEFKRTLDQYLNNAINQVRIKKGRKLLRDNWELFAAIDKEFPVQSRFLVALWGIETNFGSNQGNVSIIQALVTLAYDTRRSAYFRRELLDALRIIDIKAASLTQMKGSWAGAMGQVQFMPSVFLQNAVDLNKDGKRDLWESREDALASAAKYLGSLGWKRHWNWGREVEVPEELNPKFQGLNTRLLLSDWQDKGVRSLGGAGLPAVHVKASLIQPDGPEGRSFLVYNNYRKILSWNRSHNFAIAVGLLADQIGK